MSDQAARYQRITPAQAPQPRTDRARSRPGTRSPDDHQDAVATRNVFVTVTLRTAPTARRRAGGKPLSHRSPGGNERPPFNRLRASQSFYLAFAK